METVMVNLKINGIPVEVPAGTTILEAAQAANIEIPSLCYLKELNCIGACRVCVVEVKGRPQLLAACVYPVEPGMEVLTNTPRVRQSRKTTLELLLSTHKKKCLSCVRSGNCELQRLSIEYGCDPEMFETEDDRFEIDNSSPYIVRDNDKCISCRRCVAACKKQGISVIGMAKRGYDSHIGCAFENNLGDSPCVGCGQCVVACPVGALTEVDQTQPIRDAIADPEKKVVVYTAPSIRATLGEEFGIEPGTNVEGKMVAAIRRLGVDEVFNMDVTADLTILEEATELIQRIQNGDTLPMFTSCCPGWVKFVEHYYPEFIPNLSTCKSPQAMFGAVLKSYYCQKNNIDPKNLFVVSVIPCTAKKFENTREELNSNEDFLDVDVALTTRELGRMIKEAGIRFTELADEKYDDPFEIATGGGAIFGATGGVLEAALRTAATMLDGSFDVIDFKEVRGPEVVREATYTVAGVTVKVAVTSGLGNAKALLERIKNGEADYQFVEVMACPGGCINGGGQPIQSDSVKNFVDLKALRSQALYTYDENNAIRRSHESPVVKKLYDEFFETPGAHKAHELLHTTYVKRSKF